MNGFDLKEGVGMGISGASFCLTEGERKRKRTKKKEKENVQRKLRRTTETKDRITPLTCNNTLCHFISAITFMIVSYIVWQVVDGNNKERDKGRDRVCKITQTLKSLSSRTSTIITLI